MKKVTDPHALLLQVVAHDLLAPLTAIKWQCELLERPNLDDDKRREYTGNIHRSAELGITVSKHAHTAARVLSGTYTGTTKQTMLDAVCTASYEAITEQYARHGLTLKLEVSPSEREHAVDTELVSFYAWLTAKYFLTITPAGKTVVVQGSPGESYGVKNYNLLVRVEGVAEHEQYVTSFTEQEPSSAHDQTFVFAHLLQQVAPLLHATTELTAEGKALVLKTIFSFE